MNNLSFSDTIKQKIIEGIMLITGVGLTVSPVWADTNSLALTASLDVKKQALNLPAILIFTLFVSLTLIITAWAAQQNQSREAFYTAGGRIPAWQNGIAISGDFLSAATFLGITSVIFFEGMDGLILIAGTLAAWPIVLLLISERLRNLGRFTFIDVISARMRSDKIRPIAALSSLSVLAFYLIAQLVGAGKLIQLLFGLDYKIAIFAVSALMVIYIVFGGMFAATWVQFIKAILLIFAGIVLSFLILRSFDFDLERIIREVTDYHPKGQAVFQAGGWLKHPLSVISTGLTLVFGFIGLPHILMRLFTVKTARQSRKSAFYALLIIGIFQLMIILIGFSAIALIVNTPDYYNASDQLIGGRNMVVLHVAHFLGGNLFLGFISAVSFATILAVVAGLTISAAATISHDLYAHFSRKKHVSEKQEMRISRYAVIGMGVFAIVFGLVFENQNIVFIANLAMAIAASSNAPVLLLVLYWPGLTGRGVIWGMLTGLISSILLILAGPQVWVDILGFNTPLFPYAYPTILSVPLAFFAAWLGSRLDHSKQGEAEKNAFLDQLVQAETGYKKQNFSSK